MTKIAISALDANGLDSRISPHFGRCPYFTIVEVLEQEVKGVESVENPYYANHEPGQVPGFVHELGAQVMLTGGMGGRAVTFFKQFGIECATGASGTAQDALSLYLGGKLSGTAPCSESVEHGHHQ